MPITGGCQAQALSIILFDLPYAGMVSEALSEN
jgi:hypothetical protein